MASTGKRSQWRAILLPLVVLGLIVSAVAIFKPHPRRGSLITGRGKRGLGGIFSPATIRAIDGDELFRRNYVAMVDITAGAADWLTKRYPSDDLREASETLNMHRREIRSTSNLADNSSAAEYRRALPDPFAGIGDAFMGGLAKIGSGILADLGGAGMFLGVGVGQGVASGLNVTTAANAKVVAAKVVASSGMNATGLNPAIQNLGSGLAGTISGSLNLSSLTSGIQIGPVAMGLAVGIGNGAVSGLKINTVAPPNPNATGIPDIAGMFGFGLTSTVTSNINVSAITSSLGNGANTQQLMAQLPSAALGLAQGVGGGLVNGLKINTATVPSNGTGVPDIANNFGFGLTQSVSSNINVSDITSNLGNSATTQQLMAQLPSAALGLAQGVGDGLVNGLKINTATVPANGTGVPDIANNFGFGLTQSVSSNINVSAITSNLGNTAMLMQLLPPAAAGFGKGLGEGIPIGLGVQPDPGMLPLQTMPDGSIDASGVAENFAMGLTSRLLANGTISKVMSMASTSGAAGLLGSVDVGKAVGGFARGLLQGAGDSITAMGGLQALLDGTATTPTGPITDTPVQFNDSTGGAAIGFGQGFGGQGVMVAKSLLSSVMITQKKREVDRTERSGVDVWAPIQARQTDVVMSNGSGLSFNLSTILNSASLSTIIQKGIDILTPNGVGGLVLIASGLAGSGALPVDSQSLGTISQIKDMIPNGTVDFTTGGHNFQIDMQQVVNNLNGSLLDAANGLTINGNKGVAFGVFLVAHILLAIIALLTVLPLVLGLESARNIFLRLRKPQHLTWAPKWTNLGWLLVVAPSVILIPIFGILLMGNSGHFRTFHGIVGLLTAIDGLVAVTLHLMAKFYGAAPGQPPTLAQKMRGYNNQLFLFIASVATLSGFTDLSAITVGLTHIVPFELALSAGFGLANVFTIGGGVSQFEMYLSFRDAKMQKKMLKNGSANPSSGANEAGYKVGDTKEMMI